MAYTLKILDKGNEPIVKNTLGKNLIGGLAKGVENAENFLRLGAGAISDPLGIKSVQGAIDTFYPKDQQLQKEKIPGFRKLISPIVAEPKTIPEREIEDIIGNVAFNIASAGLSGGIKHARDIGSIASHAFKRSVQGKAGKYAAKAAGLGDFGQFLGEVGVPVALEALNIDNLVKGISPIQRDLYEATEEAAGWKKVQDYDVKKYVARKLNSKLLKGPESKDVKDNLIKIYESFDKDNKIDVIDAFRFKTNINELLSDSKVPDISKKYYKPLQPLFANVLEKSSKEYPEFGKYYNDANNLTRITSQAKEISDFAKEAFEKVTVIQPIKYLFSGAKLLGSQATNAVGTAAQIGIDHPDQFFKYYNKALSAAAQKQFPVFLSNVNKMQKLLKTNDKSKSSNKSGFTLNIIE